MGRSFIYFLLCSLAIHALLFHFQSAPSAPRQELHYLSEVPVIRESPALKKAGQGGISGLGIRDLLPSGSATVSIPQGPGNGRGTNSRPHGFGHGTGLEGMRDTVAQREVHDRIDHQLYYPAEFLEAKIEGQARIRFSFDQEGKIIPGSIRIKCLNNYLRVFLHRVLREAFQTALPSSYVKSGLLEFSASVAFHHKDVTNPFYNELDPVKGLNQYGNTLYFQRSGKLIGEWELGPFAGYGPNLSISLPWFYETAEGLLSNKEKPDPLRKYRQDPLWSRND